MAKSKILNALNAFRKKPTEDGQEEPGGCAKPKEVKSLYRQYEGALKKAAIVIAIVLLYQVLSSTDQAYTSLATDKNSMLKLFWAAVFIGYSIGGTPTALKTIAITGIALLIIPVFFQTSPQQMVRKTVSIISPSAPPRDLEWMSREIKPIPEKIVRVYNGDKFTYKAPSGFWVLEEGGPKHFHNPSLRPGEVRNFSFYDLPAEGREIKIQTEEGGIAFWMDFRITKG